MLNHQLLRKNIPVLTSKSLFYTFCITLLISINCTNVRAETMGNESYLLKADVNLPVAKDSNQNTPEKTIKTNLNSTYYISTGFDFYHSKNYFRFTIPDVSVDFGELTPTNPQKRISTILIDPGSAIGYIVLSNENHPLQNISKNIIPDTTCDDGQCSKTSSSLWTNPLTFGFGYNLNESTDNYQPFASDAKNDPPVPIMNGTREKNKIQITYKVNISQTQAQGWYNNDITYVATPNF